MGGAAAATGAGVAALAQVGARTVRVRFAARGYCSIWVSFVLRTASYSSCESSPVQLALTIDLRVCRSKFARELTNEMELYEFVLRVMLGFMSYQNPKF